MPRADRNEIDAAIRRWDIDPGDPDTYLGISESYEANYDALWDWNQEANMGYRINEIQRDAKLLAQWASDPDPDDYVEQMP